MPGSKPAEFGVWFRMTWRSNHGEAYSLLVTAAVVSLASPVWARMHPRAHPQGRDQDAGLRKRRRMPFTQQQQRLHYKFRAEGPLNFKVSHQEEKRSSTSSATLRKARPAASCPEIRDYCLVWTNAATLGDSSLRISARFAVNHTKGTRAAVSASPEDAVLLLHGAWMNRWS